MLHQTIQQLHQQLQSVNTVQWLPLPQVHHLIQLFVPMHQLVIGVYQQVAQHVYSTPQQSLQLPQEQLLIQQTVLVV